MINEVQEILINESEIQEKVKYLAEQINKDYAGKDIVLMIILKGRGANVEICTLLSKPARRETQVDVKYEGFEIPDEFVVGYGMDYDERFRNLPYIGILKREVYGG